VHQDDGDQSVGRVVESVEVGGLFELGHDLLGQCPWQLVRTARMIGGEE
jgi:hypothetical protein